MTFVITSPCIDTKDQACVDVCPVDCIHFEDGVDTMLYINPVECIDCGACEPACPVDAIFEEGSVPDDQSNFIEINSLWYDDPAAARTQLSGGTAEPAAEPTAEPAAEPAAEPTAEPTSTAATDADASVAEEQSSVTASAEPEKAQVSLRPHASKQDYAKAIAGLEFPISRDGLLRGAKDKGGIDREVSMVISMLNDKKFISEDELLARIRATYLAMGAHEEDLPV
tara:strand:+ start:326 stop:1003 length:678 start_codon:yes stop_codon:yes gene_type:complete